MRPLVTLFLLVVLSISTLGCHKETEQDKVKKIIIDIQKAVDDKNVKKIINNFRRPTVIRRDITAKRSKGS
jgi:hypothetical protein